MRKQQEDDCAVFKPSLYERRSTDVSPKHQSFFGTRFTNTALNIRIKRGLFTDEALPKLELSMELNNNLALAGPIRGKHIFLAKTDLRQFQHYQSVPKNYREYLKTHKKRKDSTDNSSQKYDGIHSNTLIMCRSIQLENEESPCLLKRKTNE